MYMLGKVSWGAWSRQVCREQSVIVYVTDRSVCRDTVVDHASSLFSFALFPILKMSRNTVWTSSVSSHSREIKCPRASEPSIGFSFTAKSSQSCFKVSNSFSVLISNLPSLVLLLHGTEQMSQLLGVYQFSGFECLPVFWLWSNAIAWHLQLFLVGAASLEYIEKWTFFSWWKEGNGEHEKLGWWGTVLMLFFFWAFPPSKFSFGIRVRTSAWRWIFRSSLQARLQVKCQSANTPTKF